MRPTWVEIKLGAIKHNLQTVKNITGRDISVLAVVKADAYGHGAVEVSRALSESGVDMFGVATLDEGMELRESGINEPVVLLGGIQDDEAETALVNGLIPAVYLLSTLEKISEVALRKNSQYPCHIKIDTGMSRLGFAADEVEDVVRYLSEHKEIQIKGIFTHFSSADVPDCGNTEKQIQSFREIIQLFRKKNIQPEYIHMANSAAIQRYPESFGNLVRPGIMIYGACATGDLHLEPAMCLKSRIIQLKKLPAGIPVSYGGTYVTRGESIIAVIPIGYADGYLRLFSNNAEVSVKGVRAPVVGTVCMDFTMVDVTHIKNVSTGDEVILFGNESVSVDDLAERGGTIPYEVMTIVGKRVKKVFV